MPDSHDLLTTPSLSSPLNRRGFFARLAVGGAAVAALPHLAGCDTAEPVPPPTPGAVTLDFSNDFGVLNYAYALEQLEYAFYVQVVGGSYFAGASSQEQQILDDLRKHEQAHVDFLKAAIPALGGTLIGDLTPDFSSVDFSNRGSVLETARLLEDTGVSAYNGAGQYLTNPDLLTIAGKIVSVEARHAAAIRDVLMGGVAFAGDDVVDANGLDVVATPSAVLNGASGLIANTITLVNVPTA